MTYEDVVNLSMNQVLARSINTSLVAILPVLSVLVIGAEILGASTLQYFGLALVIGLTSGAYSSIFIASPILVAAERARAALHEHPPEARQPRHTCRAAHPGGRRGHVGRARRPAGRRDRSQRSRRGPSARSASGGPARTDASARQRSSSHRAMDQQIPQVWRVHAGPEENGGAPAPAARTTPRRRGHEGAGQPAGETPASTQGQGARRKGSEAALSRGPRNRPAPVAGGRRLALARRLRQVPWMGW